MYNYRLLRKKDDNFKRQDSLIYCENPDTTFRRMNLSFDFMTYSTSECETAVRLLIEDGFLIKIENRNNAIAYKVKESMKLHILSKAHYGI